MGNANPPRTGNGVTKDERQTLRAMVRNGSLPTLLGQLMSHQRKRYISTEWCNGGGKADTQGKLSGSDHEREKRGKEEKRKRGKGAREPQMGVLEGNSRKVGRAN
jgi:hypothetical protein